MVVGGMPFPRPHHQMRTGERTQTSEDYSMTTDYQETRIWDRLTVNYAAAVITFTVTLARYGFLFGASVAALAVLWGGLPAGGAAWLRAVLLVLVGGGAVAGLFGGVAIVVKDAAYPYVQPHQTIRQLPEVAAPEDMKPRPLMSVQGSTFKYGKLKLEVGQLLALAQHVLAGETISQRNLARWGVVPTKESDQARQLKADIEYLGYGTPTGNGQLQATEAFRVYLAGLFPALPPYPGRAQVAANGGVDRHRHQTPGASN